MSGISAEEWELVSFFEVQAEYADPSDPWPYTDALFRVSRGAVELSFAVTPADKDVRIILKVADSIAYELNAMTVVDVRYRREGKQEFLDVIFDTDNVLTLSVKPEIKLEHAARRND
jgi:hypothetical protein